MILLRRRVAFLFLIFLLSYFSLLGQDPHFSQFYAHPIYMNPAFAGTSNCPRFCFNFRDQWPAIKGNFMTFSGSYDQYINAIHGGIGVIAYGDFQGKNILKTYNFSAIYNFRVEVSPKFSLQFALQGGYYTSSLDWTKLQFASEYLLDNFFPSYFPDAFSNDLKKSQFDAAFGFVGYSQYVYFGIAMHHLFPMQLCYLRNYITKPNTKWEPKYTLHVGGSVPIKQKERRKENFGDIFFLPNIIYISQGNFNFLHEGFYFNFYPLTIGTWLRHNFKNLDAFIVSCGIEYKLIRIGYSFDFNLTKLERTGGVHEVSLQITIPCNIDQKSNSSKKKKKSTLLMECPKF